MPDVVRTWWQVLDSDMWWTVSVIGRFVVDEVSRAGRRKKARCSLAEEVMALRHAVQRRWARMASRIGK